MGCLGLADDPGIFMNSCIPEPTLASSHSSVNNNQLTGFRRTRCFYTTTVFHSEDIDLSLMMEFEVEEGKAKHLCQYCSHSTDTEESLSQHIRAIHKLDEQKMLNLNMRVGQEDSGRHESSC